MESLLVSKEIFLFPPWCKVFTMIALEVSMLGQLSRAELVDLLLAEVWLTDQGLLGRPMEEERSGASRPGGIGLPSWLGP